MIGDAIRFSPGSGEEEGWIDEILQRKNELVRPPVANVSYLMIVIAPEPKPDLLMTDALLVEARRQWITPVLIINKTDFDAALCEEIYAQYTGTGDTILITSVKTGEGLDELKTLLKRGICCFAGQSGVGKSSLVSAATGLNLEVGEISQKIGRGKHTTRHAELLVHEGFQVLDTAGFSLLSQSETEDPILLKSYYPEFSTYEAQCRFQPVITLANPAAPYSRHGMTGGSPGNVSCGIINCLTMQRKRGTNDMSKLAASILAANTMHMGDAVRRILDSGCDAVHFDVMDGVFVPNISFGPNLLRDMRKEFDAYFDVHLMLYNPLKYIDVFHQSGADAITVHVESESYWESIKRIKELGLRTGASLKPGTPAEKLFELDELPDQVLVMTVEPGFGGQSLLPDTVEKISELRRLGYRV